MLAFFAVIFLMDRAAGSLLKHFYYKQDSGFDYSSTYAMDKTTADILVLGSSRAVNIFDTKLFSDKFNGSCYNAGRYGEPIFYHYAILKSALKRYKPKMIILSFDAGSFSKSAESYDRLSVLLPYYKNHPEIRPIVTLKGPYEKLKMLSSTYPYNSLLLPIITGNTTFNKAKYANENGFIPIERNFAGSLQTFDYTKELKLDTNKINTYKMLIEDCLANQIPLYITCPPYMINAIGIDSSLSKAIKIAAEKKVHFFDYSRDSFFTTKPALFADYRHLNKEGVLLFCNKIIKRIEDTK